jgi:hypothetical protein
VITRSGYLRMFFLCLFALSGSFLGATAVPPGVTFSQSAETVEVYDFLELTLTVREPDASNPFTDVQVAGSFALEGQEPVEVDGFCDSPDGSLYRIRFMPGKAGPYRYTVTFTQGDHRQSSEGRFEATASGRKGLLRVDGEYPWHFIWEGTGEHYFWNGTTTYYLMGWQDDGTIRATLDRLASFQINRARVLIYGRNHDRPWGQPVRSSEVFKLYLNPWQAARPDDVEDPGFDLSRFNVDYWQKYESMLSHARQKDIVVSVIFFIGAQVLPAPFAADSKEEQLYYRYAVARLAAFSNVTWDLGNEHDFHRWPGWAERAGLRVKAWDPYDHLLSAHNRTYRDAGSSWNDMQLIQRWDQGQNAYMLRERTHQFLSGRIIPQVNEEYGYEDLWEAYQGQRSAETRRRAAWAVSMAGCYQTTGETANGGTGFPPDTGGGWVSGRGEVGNTMLPYYRHLHDFFTSFEWWKTTPQNEVVSDGMMALIGEESVAVYAPEGGRVTINGLKGAWRAEWFDPRTGQWRTAGEVRKGAWQSSDPPDKGDWALLLRRQQFEQASID